MTNNHNNNVGDVLRRTLRRLVFATVVLYLFLAGLVAFVWVDGMSQRAEIRNVALTTNTALCTLRHDLEKRIETSQQFLEENPNGIPGFSAEVIEQSIANQQDTIEALEVLRCP